MTRGGPPDRRCPTTSRTPRTPAPPAAVFVKARPAFEQGFSEPTRTGDPFITRETRRWEWRVAATHDGQVLPANQRDSMRPSGPAVDASGPPDVPLTYPRGRAPVSSAGAHVAADPAIPCFDSSFRGPLSRKADEHRRPKGGLRLGASQGQSWTRLRTEAVDFVTGRIRFATPKGRSTGRGATGISRGRISLAGRIESGRRSGGGPAALPMSLARLLGENERNLRIAILERASGTSNRLMRLAHFPLPTSTWARRRRRRSSRGPRS